MSLLLYNFKQVIPQTILERGRTYFRNGQVIDLSLEDETTWSAQVEGSEVYDVQIEQEADGTLTCTCTCPYEHGEYCKHVAAVLYAIEDAFPEYFEGKKPRKPGKKRVTRADKLQTALAAASESELRAFLLDLAREDRAVYNNVLLRFGGTVDSAINYDQMVKDALRAGRGDHGYMDYQGAMVAAKGVQNLLRRANDLMAQHHADRALPIYRAIAENVTDAYQETDDSSGSLYDCIEHAMEGIENCADQLTGAARRALFETCLQVAQSDRFRDQEQRWDWLGIAAKMVETPDERVALFTALDAIDGPTPKSASRYNGYVAAFDRERTAELRLEVIERLDGSAAANTFIQANLHLKGFKERVIEEHIERGELAEAKALVQKAIQDAEAERLPGLGRGYQEYLLTIAEREGDTKTVIRMARDAFLSRADERYYTLLKKTIPAGQWSAFVEDLLRDIKKSDYDADLSAGVLAREGLWDRLLALVKENSPSLAELYRAELEKRFAPDMAALYEKFTMNILRHSGNRDGYRRACDYLRRMQKLGQAARVETIRATLREQYRNRPALLEELSKV